MNELYMKFFSSKSKDIIFESKRIDYVRISDEFIEDYLKMVNNTKINKYISTKK